MALLDGQLQFDFETEHLTTERSANILDFGEARDLGVGNTIELVVMVATTMTDAGTDSTMQIDLQTDSATAFSSPTTTRTIGTFPAGSVAGTTMKIKLAAGDINEKCASLYYTVANGNLTTGKYTAFILLTSDQSTAYPTSVVI